MTDKTMPADKAREIITGMRESMRRAEGDGTSPKFMGSMLVYVAALEALLPPPPRPTLAGMTRDERAACRWMQADVKGRSARYVIATPADRSGLAGLVSADGGIEWTYPERVTPRPDLPRMEWPSTGQGAEDANPVKVGDVIESAADPRLAALPVGTILRDCDGDEVVKRGGDWAGLGYIPRESEGTEFGPWTVLHTGQGAGPAPVPALPDGWRLADHPDHGRGVVTTPTPNSDGRVCFAIPSGSPLGYNWHLCYPNELTYLDDDQGAGTPDAVPESTLAVGSEWGSADALRWACEETGRDQIVALDRAGDAYVWSGAVKLWETSSPMSVNAPFTILHRGKKGDQ